MASGQVIGFTSFQAPSGTIGDDAMNANSPAGVTKTRHLHKPFTTFGFGTADTPTTKTFTIHRAATAGTVRNFRGLLTLDGSSTSITMDLKKNGSSILSGTISLTHSTGDGTAVAGSISSATYVAGDLFTVVMTVSSATGAQGPYAEAEFDELAA